MKIAKIPSLSSQKTTTTTCILLLIAVAFNLSLLQVAKADCADNCCAPKPPPPVIKPICVQKEIVVKPVCVQNVVKPICVPKPPPPPPKCCAPVVKPICEPSPPRDPCCEISFAGESLHFVNFSIGFICLVLGIFVCIQ